MEDGDAGSEFGSVISLQSLDDSSQYQEKPRRVKKSKGRVDHSPYLSQSLGGQGTKSGPRKTGHEAWSSAIRNGFTGLSSENSPANRLASPQVQRKFKSRSSGNNGGPFSRDEHVLASGKPAYKSQEDYYDEIIELRQVIKELKVDNGVLKTKLQRITQENVLKDRQIKDFLNPNKQPEEIRRTLTDKNADSSAVVSSLKQKLHLMERNLKDKENELRKLKSDLKSTNIDELRIEMETYFEETRRLQTVLSSVYSQAPGTRNLPDTRYNASRSSSRMNTPRRDGLDTADNGQLEVILDENRRLKSENQSLKKDLLCAIDGQRNKDSYSKDMNVDYADMNRLQMLRKIGELEQSLEDANAKRKSEPKDSKKQSSGDDDEVELRDVIENLKQDRTHYRKEAEKLRTKLETAEDELAKLKTKTKKMIEEHKEKLRDVNEEYKQKINVDKKDKAHSTMSPPRPTPKQRDKTGSAKKKISFQEDIVKEHQQGDVFSHNEDEAARVLQRNWRQHNKQKNSPRDDDIVRIQSALRAHAIRRERVQLLSNADDVVEEDLEWEDAVTRVQSAMRAHHARRKYYSNAERFSRYHSSREHSDDSDKQEKPEKRKSFKQQSFLKKSQSSTSNSFEQRNVKRLVDDNTNDSDDSDDDVIIGGSRLNLRNDTKKPSPPEEAPVWKQMSLAAVNNRQLPGNGRGKNEVNSEDSDDNVQVSTRFGKSVSSASKKNTNSNQSGFLFGNSTRKKEFDEQRLRNFFGKENNETNGLNNKGSDNEPSLDNFFTSSRSTQQRFHSEAGSDPESEANLTKKSTKNETIVDEKPKKSLFSWGSTKRNTPKNAPVPAPRKIIKSANKVSSKSANVWSSRPSGTFGDDDDDDDDDAVVTPKISRKNPTKTASLLDELF